MLAWVMLRDQLLTYAQHKVHPQVRGWLSEAAITANLAEEVDEALERLQSNALAAEFRHYCPVAGARVEDYKNRMLEVDNLELLTGIRFLGGDLTQPFVDVVFQSEAVLTAEQLGAVREAIRQAFAVFQPERARFYLSSHQPRFSEDGDKRLIAAPLGAMLRTRPEHLSRVHLRRATSLTFYPRYTALYDQLHSERPELLEVAGAESEEAMRAYLDEGGLFEVFVDDQWAGVTAVFRSVDTGLSGFCVAEIVLAGAFRGRGLGSAVQIRLAEALVQRGAQESDILFGTVGEVNVAARRTALRAGRTDLGGHAWVPLA